MDPAMDQTARLLDTLKQYLKAKGMTYREIARKLNLSEASIKRLFSEETFTLKRLEALCREVDLDLYDLVLMARQREGRQDQKLTHEQETALSKDASLIYFFYFLANGWKVAEIIADYEFTEDQAQRYLILLDKLGLIELHAGNRFRVLVSSNIFWNRGGPLWQKYEGEFVNDFLLGHRFDKPNERMEFCPGVVTEDSFRIIMRKLDAVVAQFNDLAELDAALPLKNRYSAGLVVGLRPWIFSGMAEMRRKR